MIERGPSLWDFLVSYLTTGANAWLDVTLLAIIGYAIFLLIRHTRAYRIVLGIFCLIVLYLIADALNLVILQNLMQATSLVGTFALVVLFQPELRGFLERLGNFGDLRRRLSRGHVSHSLIRELNNALSHISNTGWGALIVLERETGLQDYIQETGLILDANVSSDLLISIFSKESPLHDGAVVVRDKRITAAKVLLPLASGFSQVSHHGTRHRAALGITEATDAIAIVVSEQTGAISVAYRGRMRENLTLSQFRKLLVFHLQAERTGVWNKIYHRNNENSNKTSPAK